MAKAAASTADKDFEDHIKTFTAFKGLVKWGIIGCAVLVVFLYIVIRP